MISYNRVIHLNHSGGLWLLEAYSLGALHPPYTPSPTERVAACKRTIIILYSLNLSCYTEI